MKKETIWSKTFVFIVIIQFLISLTQSMTNPILPKLSASLGATATLVGFIVGVFSFTGMFLRPFTSPACDSFPRKMVLSVAVLGNIIAFLGYSFATNTTMVIIFRFIHGVGASITTPLTLALASNSLPKAKLATGMAIYSGLLATINLFGPSLGLYLASHFGYGVAYRVTAGLLLLAAVMVQFVDEPKIPRPKYKISLKSVIAKGAILPSTLMLFLCISQPAVASFLTLYAGLRGVENIGLYYTAYAVTNIIMRPISGKIIDRFSYNTVLIPCISFYALGFVLISQATSLPYFIAAGACVALGFGLCSPTVQSLCMRCTPRAQRGSAGSTNFLFMDVGNIIGPLASGFVIDHLKATGMPEVDAYSKMYLIMIIPMVMGLIYMILAAKKIKKSIEDADEEDKAAEMAMAAEQ